MTQRDEQIIGWGIVATGGIARTVAGDLRLLENTRLAAVSSRDADRARAFADEFGVERAYDSVKDLVNDDGVDVVYVASPHPQHAYAVRLALEAGKAVLCEKAFTHSLAETEALVELARARGVFCMEAMWTRFNPLIVRARRMIAEGVIGEVRSITAELGFAAPVDPAHRLWNPALGGGALLDVGVYPVAFAQMVLGAPAQVSAVGTLTELGVDAEAGLLLSWPGGPRAHLEATLTAPIAGAASIVGTLGRLEIAPRFHHPAQVVHVDAPERGVERREAFDHTPEGRGYVPMLRAVAQAVREGRTECAEMPLNDTVEVMRVLDEALTQLGVEYPEPAPVGL
ncbi:Gfo/Idh/MocA family protein [Phytoactinopolyspora halotolerans]|uniref:Gfo/Idh/MocA family oxidoreductase n=1 Tax=Phytoactinopolyspora halotolerans TaxID=1981512 RepID=A0A6L9SD66_9ACTN|nr:Gfo/Idh/MocA family oxidoreductase [Phytoactinopolyspora halotolerans]NEE03186.1 Gfo/Idh/MocA family oxidoreductase [Phytoactinopolyspora halotolerans]